MRIRSRLAVVLALTLASSAHVQQAHADAPAASSAPATSSAPAASGAPATPGAPATSGAPAALAAPSVTPNAAPPAPASTVTAGAPAASSAPAAPGVVAAPRGLVVIAIGDDAIVAARALAREAYADETMRPSIDDATARVLAGEAPPALASAKLTEIAEVRKAALTAPNDAVTRRLFASLGADLGAVLVVPVTLHDGKPTARIVSVAKAAFEPVELSGSFEAQPDGSSRVKWASVTPILSSFLPRTEAPAASGKPGPQASASAAAGPLAPKKDEPSRSFWTSPWTWAGIGVVVTAGVVVFALSQANGSSSTLHLQGRVDK